MAIDIRLRLRPSAVSLIYLIGPGGAGKSTVGRILSQKLCFSFRDLDVEFMTRVGHIDEFIHEHGYDFYMETNSGLAHSIAKSDDRPLAIALSSGFMMIDTAPLYGERNRKLVQDTGYSILLLPSADMDEATEITVARQLARGFGLEAERERAKIRNRFPAYSRLGDMQVCSVAPPEKIASAIASWFKHPAD